MVRLPPALLPVCFLAACAPGSTRPAFRPFPQALSSVLAGRPAAVIPEISAWLQAESVRVAFAHAGDGYLETDWYDVRTHRSRGTPHLDATIKIRCWADADAQGKFRLTIEPVYRPFSDASRAPRDLELIPPPEHEGYKIAERLLEAMQRKFGG
ncbi:MAG: hypothetical protein ACREL9_06295 [Gemmatimonadales bacterium]